MLTVKKIASYTYKLASSNEQVLIFSNESLLSHLEQEVLTQLKNVSKLPGVVFPVCAMPDAHAGYGFPIGGVAGFDPQQDGVISAGGVGFDIACGVRTLLSPLTYSEIRPYLEALADDLFKALPAGVGSKGSIHLSTKQLDELLLKGASWAVKNGFGLPADLEKIEDKGIASQARPDYVSEQAKKRQLQEMGTLGAGNHYAEVQVVEEIYDPKVANYFGLKLNQIVVSIHCGSRGLGHQIATDYLKEMLKNAPKFGLNLPDPNLACAPISSKLGQRYFGAMQAGINCALANRQILTHLVRNVFKTLFQVPLSLLYDVSHNTCRPEIHEINGQKKLLYIHRKGATRSFGPGHPSLPVCYQTTGQPVIIGGSMGTFSYILAGNNKSLELSFGSTCHGAGRIMSRKQAKKRYSGRELIKELAKQEIILRGASLRGLAEEAPGAYKDINQVIDVTHKLGLATRVARLRPLIVIKG